MPLDYPGAWRFTPPSDGAFINQKLPWGAVREFLDAIDKVRSPNPQKWVLEHFKGYFGAHSTSSNEGWAYSDLSSAMDLTAENAPHFVECYYDACEDLRNQGIYAPVDSWINGVLARHNVGYEIQSGNLIARELGGPLVVVEPPSPSLSESARKTLDTSLKRSEELLSEGRAREAVQEVLWLLETIATAFRGLETESGRVEGKYFNKIVGDLRKMLPGTTLNKVLDWITTMHGYLSAPAGGGVRHGMDLSSKVDLDINQARLFCNLTRSYISYLVVEHDSLSQRASGH